MTNSGLTEFVQELQGMRFEQQQRIDQLVQRRDQAKAAKRRITEGVETQIRAAGYEVRDLTTDELRAARPNYRAADDELKAISTEIEEAKQAVAGLDERIKDVTEDVQREGADNPTLQRIKRAAGIDTSGGDNMTLETKRLPGRTGNPHAPLRFDEEQLRAAHRALATGQRYHLQARAFNSVDSLLPSELFPAVLGPLHEGRLADKLPTLPMAGPSLEYIRHTSTTGTPSLVNEGATKPELTFVTDQVTVQAKKIACHAAVSYEIMEDWSTFASYVQTEIMRQVIDVETAALLNGSSGIVGLLQTSGILSHTVGGTGTTPNGETSLDAIESAIAQLRSGAALATANLLVLHPNTWSAIRRSKDGQQRYMTQADPTVGEANTVWGCEVLTTTAIAAGTGCLLDTNKFGHFLVRTPLSLIVGYMNDDLVKNLIRSVCEQRINLAVERPAAVCAIENLPTS